MSLRGSHSFPSRQTRDDAGKQALTPAPPPACRSMHNGPLREREGKVQVHNRIPTSGLLFFLEDISEPTLKGMPRSGWRSLLVAVQLCI